MRTVIQLVLLAGLALVAYLCFYPGASIQDLTAFLPQSDKTSSSAPTPAPAAKVSQKPSENEVIRLRDGSKVEGKVIIRDAKLIVVRVAGGKTVQIDTEDVLTAP